MPAVNRPRALPPRSAHAANTVGALRSRSRNSCVPVRGRKCPVWPASAGVVLRNRIGRVRERHVPRVRSGPSVVASTWRDEVRTHSRRAMGVDHSLWRPVVPEGVDHGQRFVGRTPLPQAWSNACCPQARPTRARSAPCDRALGCRARTGHDPSSFGTLIAGEPWAVARVVDEREHARRSGSRCSRLAPPTGFWYSRPASRARERPRGPRPRARPGGFADHGEAARL